MNNQISSLKTARLTLRMMQFEDANILYRIYQTEGVLNYFPSTTPPPIEKVEKFIEEQKTHWEKYDYGNWAIVPDGSNEIIGWVGLQYLPELNETEVGYLLDKPYWGKGYATESAMASIKFGFRQIHLDHIIALVHPENKASQHVIDKCGLDYLETIHLWGIDLMKYHIHRDDESISSTTNI